LIFGKHINKYYIKYAPLLLLGVVALIAVDFAQLKIPEYYRQIVNGLNGMPIEVEGTLQEFNMDFLLDKICLPLIIIMIVMVIGRFAWRIGFFGTSILVESDLRDHMFDKAKDLSQQYYSVNKVGDIMSYFTNDLETIQECFGDGILTTMDAIFLGTMSFIKMFRMNWKLGLFSFIPMIAMFFAAKFLGKRMEDTWEERQQKFSKLSDFSQESFSGLAVIKAFAKEIRELKEFHGINKENEEVNVRYVKYHTGMDVMIEFFFSTVICIILGYGCYLVAGGVFDAGELVEFVGYFDAIVWPILAVSMVIDMSARGRASLKRVGDFLDTKQDVCDSPMVQERIKNHDPLATPTIKGNIRFRHLSFTYPGSEVEVLHSVSFTIQAGENVGLIGKTGSGKTTIVDLIARTYNVQDGSILIDGMDVNEIPIKELRKHIAYVPQDNFLFSTKIGDNIAFAFEDADDQKAIEEAAKLADVYGNIEEFPEQFDTMLGERGVTVSGGQKQRISIARALMKNAEILILDDSVSAVDTKTEKIILDNLRTTRKGKTTILIAHRISTIESMDKIIFIDNGSIVDVGNHQELLNRCPAYQEMVEMQRLEDLEEEKKHA